MGVSAKNRRKINIDGRIYVWYVAEDHDDFPPTVDEGENLMALNIISEDKRFIVRYHLGQSKSDGQHITVIGREFGEAVYSGTWRRFLCPDWCAQASVTPSDVRGVIEWCQNPEIVHILVDYTGLPIEPPNKQEG